MNEVCALFVVAVRHCGTVYNWLVYCVVGNTVCRTWESCTLAFPCAVNGVIHDAIACYAHFHNAKLFFPASFSSCFHIPRQPHKRAASPVPELLLREKPPACDVLRCIKAVFRFPFLQIFPHGVFSGFRNFHQKSFNLPLFGLSLTAHGLCPPANLPRQSRRGRTVLPA